jgi:hypothetical protein
VLPTAVCTSGITAIVQQLGIEGTGKSAPVPAFFDAPVVGAAGLAPLDQTNQHRLDQSWLPELVIQPQAFL